MEIRKPKPIHRWQDFAKEVGIIVLSIVIALGGEQVVQTLHWRHQVQEARLALHREIGLSLGYAAERQAVAPCLEARISQLRDKLIDPGATWAPLPELPASRAHHRLPAVYNAPQRPWVTAAWRAAMTGGVLDHMPRSEAHDLAVLYDQIETMAVRQDKEIELAAGLAPLGFPAELEGPERRRYLSILGGVDAEAGALTIFTRQLLDQGARLRIDPDAAEVERLLAAQRERRGACVLARSALETEPTH